VRAVHEAFFQYFCWSSMRLKGMAMMLLSWSWLMVCFMKTLDKVARDLI
jgi:hypothetical protein